MFATFTALSVTCLLTLITAAVLNKLLKLKVDELKPKTGRE
ncbi:MAG: hypothetical protein AAFU78_11750 [Cyanobacteria bacterium J06633_2]